jgi:hypothetical protein
MSPGSTCLAPIALKDWSMNAAVNIPRDTFFRTFRSSSGTPISRSRSTQMGMAPATGTCAGHRVQGRSGSKQARKTARGHSRRKEAIRCGLAIGRSGGLPEINLEIAG